MLNDGNTVRHAGNPLKTFVYSKPGRDLVIMTLRFLFIVLLTLIQQAASSQDEKVAPDSSILFNISIGKKLLQDCSGSILQQSVNSFWTPGEQEFSVLKSNYHKLANQVKDLNQFVTQYAGIIMNGKRFIYINAFPKRHLSEARRIHNNLSDSAVVVCGGGEAFWRVLFDIELLEFNGFKINAPK